MLIRESVRRSGLATRLLRSAAGLWFPDYDVVLSRKNNVLAVKRSPDGKGGIRTDIVPASNIVTDDGDYYYARAAISESNIDTFGVHELGSAGTPAKDADRSAFTEIASTEKAHTSGYPMTNDDDSDNTGSGTDVISYQASYAKGDFTAATISHGWITNSPPGSGENLLTGYAFASSFEKTSDDTLKVIVNHTMNGV